MHVKTISRVKQIMQIIVITKKPSSPFFVTVRMRMSSPNKAYSVTMAMRIEKGILSTK